jgi:hypothetical protein
MAINIINRDDQEGSMISKEVWTDMPALSRRQKKKMEGE